MPPRSGEGQHPLRRRPRRGQWERLVAGADVPEDPARDERIGDRCDAMPASAAAGDHGWPQGGSRTVEATRLIWEFSEAHPREGRQEKDARDEKETEGEKEQEGEEEAGQGR